MPEKIVPRRTVEQWDQELARLYTRAERAEAELAQVIGERRRLALAATADDPKAMETVRGLNEKHGELAALIDLTRIAAGEAAEHRRKQAEIEASDARARVVDAAQAVAAELVAESSKVDEALAVVRQALERRSELAHRLAGLGFRANRLYHVECMGRALGAAGLRGRAPFVPGPQEHWKPLAAQDAGTLHAAIAPALALAKNAA